MSEQTLQSKFKNVPTGTSLACSSTSLSLNRDERTSEIGKVLGCNNPEVNLRTQASGLKVVVPVLSIFSWLNSLKGGIYDEINQMAHQPVSEKAEARS